MSEDLNFSDIITKFENGEALESMEIAYLIGRIRGYEYVVDILLGKNKKGGVGK